jgi:hypothetical protein
VPGGARSAHPGGRFRRVLLGHEDPAAVKIALATVAARDKRAERLDVVPVTRVRRPGQHTVHSADRGGTSATGRGRALTVVIVRGVKDVRKSYPDALVTKGNHRVRLVCHVKPQRTERASQQDEQQPSHRVRHNLNAAAWLVVLCILIYIYILL